MRRDRRDQQTERVEMIGGDPDVFGPRSAEQPAQRRSRVDLLALGGVVLLVIVVALAWPRSSGPSQATPSTLTTVTLTTVPMTTVTRVTVAAPITVPGREAPEPTASLAFVLTVEPASTIPGSAVTMQLEGDLSDVSSPISAVAWLDRHVDGAWRTVHWLARTSDTAQAVGEVSNDGGGSGPDAVTFGADQPVRFDVVPLAAGDYRLCRYVPLRPASTTTLVTSNPAYVCAPLIVP